MITILFAAMVLFGVCFFSFLILRVRKIARRNRANDALAEYYRRKATEGPRVYKVD